MASINDVITLAKAGFSREEIALMLAAEDQPEPEKKPEPEPEKKPEPEPEKKPEKKPEPEPEKKPEPEPEESGVDAETMLAEILGIKKLIQNGNIITSQMPQTLTTSEQADAALANIINPKQGGK